MRCTMKVNDKIKMSEFLEGYITEIYEASGHTYASVRLTDHILGSFPATFIVDYLQPFLVKDKEKECPKCGKSWTVTKFGMNVWKDCVDCNIKYEDS